jgi:hypothetical protein
MGEKLGKMSRKRKNGVIPKAKKMTRLPFFRFHSLDVFLLTVDETLQDKALPWHPERTFRVAEKEIVATHV